MKQAWELLHPHLWRYRRPVVLGMAALMLKDVLAALVPLLVRAGVDSLERGLLPRTLFWFAAGMLGLSAVKGLFQYWMRVILIGVSRDIEYDMRNQLFAHLTGQSSDFYARYRTGDIMARATNDLNAVRMMLGPGIMYWTETSLTFVFALAIMFAVDWRLTLTSLLPAPLISTAVFAFGRVVHERFEKIQVLFSDLSSRVQENLAGVRVLRAYVQEEAEMRKFADLNREFIRHNLRLVRTSGMFMPTLQSFVGLAFLLVLWAGGQRLLAGEMTVGTFLMFNFYMGMLVWPMIAMGWVVNLMQRGAASLKRLNGLMTEKPTVSPTVFSRPIDGGVDGRIELIDVRLRYSTVEALRGVSLQIPAGATVAIVGHTGSGKSSLLHLMARIMDPTSGKVLFDGHDLRELDPAAVRAAIGFVPQETFLFSTTLAENIALGAQGAARRDIAVAVEMAGLGPDLASFPEGLDTKVGERGLTLSGGQKQRTAIARAILRNPRILILDDALSSVDTVTEEGILRAISSASRERTTILVSHRVSTIRHADCIYVLEQGIVAEKGTHAELLAAGGYYADLYRKQILEEELETI